MPWCPECKAEYDASVAKCTDCDVELVEALPPDTPDDPPVIVLRASTAEQADVACATLLSEGIAAYVERPGMILPQMDNVVDHDSPELVVRVAASEVERAVALLSEAAPSEEELTEVEEASDAQ